MLVVLDPGLWRIYGNTTSFRSWLKTARKGLGKMTGIEFNISLLQDPWSRRRPETLEEKVRTILTQAALMGGSLRDDDRKTLDFLSSLSALIEEINKHSNEDRNVLPNCVVARALAASEVDVQGEGRIGGDRRPNIVATRTRGQLERQKHISDNGVLPHYHSLPGRMFDSSGTFVRIPFDVYQSRFGVDGEVEFLVKPASASPGVGTKTPKDTATESIWVFLASMVSHSAFWEISGHADCIFTAYKEATTKTTYRDASLDINTDPPPVHPRAVLEKIEELVDLPPPAKGWNVHRDFNRAIDLWDKYIADQGDGEPPRKKRKGEKAHRCKDAT